MDTLSIALLALNVVLAATVLFLLLGLPKKLAEAREDPGESRAELLSTIGALSDLPARTDASVAAAVEPIGGRIEALSKRLESRAGSRGEEAESTRQAVAEEGERIEKAVAGEGERIEKAVAGEGERIEKVVAGEGERIEKAVAGEVERIEKALGLRLEALEAAVREAAPPATPSETEEVGAVVREAVGSLASRTARMEEALEPVAARLAAIEGALKGGSAESMEDALVRVLEERGFKEVVILEGPVSDAGRSRVLVEARRDGMAYKGPVFIQEGKVVEQRLNPSFPMFP